MVIGAFLFGDRESVFAQRLLGKSSICFWWTEKFKGKCCAIRICKGCTKCCICANTKEKKELVFKVRYRVYCEEFKYEAVDNFPNQMEFDDYDSFSRHCLITHRETGMPGQAVGTKIEVKA